MTDIPLHKFICILKNKYTEGLEATSALIFLYSKNIYFKIVSKYQGVDVVMCTDTLMDFDVILYDTVRYLNNISDSTKRYELAIEYINTRFRNK